MNDIVQKAFNEFIYPNFKAYMETNSIYSPLVTKSKPKISSVFPIIPIKLLPSTMTYNNLSYGNEKYSFGFEIDINCQDKVIDNKKISSRTICEELTCLAIGFIKDNFHLKIYVDSNATITDESIHRAVIRASGTIDTIYGLDNLITKQR